MADEEHLKILRQGVAAWNEWRKTSRKLRPDLSEADLHEAHLSEADLSGANLILTNLEWADLTGACLSRANLIAADLSGAHLTKADLRGANLSEAFLAHADLEGADLTKANLRRANLREANLRGANLSGAFLAQADLLEANLNWADLSEADLSGANLRRAVLVRAVLVRAALRGAQLIWTDLRDATLTGSNVYGVSVWDIQVNERTKQQNLIIASPVKPGSTVVDNLKVAQFIYLLLNNEEIRDVIDTITSKAVLILGRFTEERKRVLDALREELRNHDYLPILFDFTPSANQATLETIKTLASMARFVIADLTDARSVLMELGAIVPAFPSVAVRLMIKKSEHEYGMLDSIRLHRSVVEDTYEYEDTDKVIASIRENIIAPAEAKVTELRRLIRPAAR
jgi:uncharacterized protein YjbI with pentapeptide repeats